MFLELTLQQSHFEEQHSLWKDAFRKTTKAKQRLEELLPTLKLAQKTIPPVYELQRVVGSSLKQLRQGIGMCMKTKVS